ncbi:hypothetical protein [Kribbella solani]|uniref:Uncharacterized protein n=1 Tax=Kribbella solani TaxID=236067 RepID=A0A841DZN5_9ACTN|nr:hypothetical protein [Kribbella solani]MBB5984023.1 hypothetical protein [Kribbella solani]
MGTTAGTTGAGTDWVLVPDVEELRPIFEHAEELLLALVVSEEDSVEDPEPWVLPAPLAGRDGALAALYRVWEVLRGAVDELALPRIEPDASTRPRLLSGSRERVPFRAVPIAAADRELLAAAVVQLEVALMPAARREAGNPWHRKRMSDLAELLEQIAYGGESEPPPLTELIQPLTRISRLLNLPPDDDTTVLLDVVRTSAATGADVELTSAQTTAYGKTATRVNTILTGGDPLARWVY